MTYGRQNLSFRPILLLSAGVVLAMVFMSSYVWFQIPTGEQVCTHWNAAGECDGYGSKFVSIFLMPIVVTGMVGIFILIPRIDPRATHIAQSRKAYTVVWGAMLLFFLALHSVLMLNLLGHVTNIGAYTPLLVGSILVVIGSYLGKIQSNYFFGIRTPWTLSSELSWTKTHRLGGKLFVLQGLLFLVGAIAIRGEVWVYLLVGSSLVVTAILMTYSYFIWKGDSEAHNR